MIPYFNIRGVYGVLSKRYPFNPSGRPGQASPRVVKIRNFPSPASLRVYVPGVSPKGEQSQPSKNVNTFPSSEK